MTNEMKKVYDKAYYEKHKAEILEKCKKYREKHKEEIKAYKEKNKKALKAYASDYNKKYYKEHKREIIDRAAKYNKDNKEKHDASVRKYARKAYAEARNNIMTSMYELPDSAKILDNKNILFQEDKYTIMKNGYLTCGNKLFHIEYAKSLGIWFYGCDIHHINCNTLDNRKNNLIALTKKEHRFAHSLLKENKESYYNWIKNKLSFYSKEG